jgi:hypothetical protein
MAQKIHTTTTGDVSGNTLGYTFDFPSLAQDDIRVSVAGVLKTLTSDYTIGQWSATGSTSNFIQFVNSTKRGTGNVRIFRETPKTGPKASFTSGSAIKADDLNNNQKQAIYVAEEFEDDMTNLAANDTSGFSINGSNIADNSITSTKIAGLNVEESDIANDAVTANKLKSSTSTDSVRAVTTNHIRDGAVTDAKIAGVAGSKVTPDFGSQTITTTGHTNIGSLTVGSTSPVIVLNDSNHSPDYRLNVETGKFKIQDTFNSNADRLVISETNTRITNNLDAEAGLDVTGTCTATTFSGSGASLTNLPSSALSGALPAIDGSALLGITSSIKRVKVVSNANEVNFGNTSAYNDHLTITFGDVASTSKFLVLAMYQIKNENDSSSSRTYAKIDNTGGSFLINRENSTNLNVYVQFNHWEFDTASNTTNRTYTLKVKSSSSHSSSNPFVQNALLLGIEFTPS